MNREPFGVPPRRWQPKMSPFWVRLSRRYRYRSLRRLQNIESIECHGIEAVADAANDGQGVLITPNHSAHYDSAALYCAADNADLPLYFMSAWQVFHLSTRFECWLMQKCGCFSVDRESNDRQAFKQAVKILQSGAYPLVVFPEGDIYHTTDVVTPFREGAAAMAISAVKRAERPILAVPCGIKFWYLDDPTEKLHQVIDQLEERLYLRSRHAFKLADRIHRLAEAALALKELDYFSRTREGRLRDRVRHLIEEVLSALEARYQVASTNGATPPERVKALRQMIIPKLAELGSPRARHAESPSREDDDGQPQQMRRDMDDLFFAIQLFSYPGDYLNDQPSIERLAETVDKFEEDILGLDLPSVRGRRRVVIQFGRPIEVERGHGRAGITALTETLRSAVQQLVDDLNLEPRR